MTSQSSDIPLGLDITTPPDALREWLGSSPARSSITLPPADCAVVCDLLSASLRSNGSWAVAFTALSVAGPASGREAFKAVSASLVRGTPLKDTLAQLPFELAGWIVMASSSLNPAETLSLAARAYISQSKLWFSIRAWFLALTTLVVVIVALSWIIGLIIVPSVSAAAPPDQLPVTVRLAPYVTVMVIILALTSVGLAGSLLARARAAFRFPASAYLLATSGVSAPWSSRLMLASKIYHEECLAVAGSKVASGVSLPDALISTPYSPAAELMAAGATPDVAFRILGSTGFGALRKKTTSLPVSLLLVTVPFVAAALIVVISSVVVPLVEMAS